MWLEPFLQKAVEGEPAAASDARYKNDRTRSFTVSEHPTDTQAEEDEGPENSVCTHKFSIDITFSVLGIKPLERFCWSSLPDASHIGQYLSL